MILDHLQIDQIFLYRQPVDMRKGRDGLAALVAAELNQEPCSPSVYLFINRSRDKLKALLWDRNGFWVFYKKLIKQRFVWPDWFEGEALALDEEHCQLLLQGFNLNGMRPHQKLMLQYAL